MMEAPEETNAALRRLLLRASRLAARRVVRPIASPA
jgi:hypothetical protein